MKTNLVLTILASIFCFSCISEEGTNQKTKSIPQTENKELILDTTNSIPILSYETKPEKIQFFLKDDEGAYYNNHLRLKSDLESKGQNLKFAMNGGMYLKDYSPQGLYIENYKTLKPIETRDTTYGNFYMKPNGIFYINKNKQAFVKTTKEFKHTAKIKYATQSGPMLVINGKLHPKFIKNSKHLNIRNGVGILPSGDLLFAMSYEPITFYDFASYFKRKGCKNALYLDGAISKTYLPEKGVEQMNGNFGVIIAEVK